MNRGLALLCRAGAALLALLAGPVPAAQPVDDRGVPWKQAAPPQRIVSLVPSLTETVCALGACGRLVGVDRNSSWPPQVKTLPRLGGLDDAQLERIVARKPDLVLASPSARVVERLEALGVPVLVLHSRSHQDVRRSIELLGTVLDEAASAQALWRRIDAQMQQAAAAVPLPMKGRSVYFEVESSPYAAGPPSFIGQTLQQLGLVNIVPAELGPFPKLSPEFVVRAQPQLVMAEASNHQAMQGRPGWAALRALQQRQWCIYPSAEYEVLVRPGPRMGDAALQLADCLVRLQAQVR